MPTIYSIYVLNPTDSSSNNYVSINVSDNIIGRVITIINKNSSNSVNICLPVGSSYIQTQNNYITINSLDSIKLTCISNTEWYYK